MFFLSLDANITLEHTRRLRSHVLFSLLHEINILAIELVAVIVSKGYLPGRQLSVVKSHDWLDRGIAMLSNMLAMQRVEEGLKHKRIKGMFY